MRRLMVAVSIMGAAVLVGAAAMRADDTSKEKELRASLIGTWRMTSMKVNGEERDLPRTSVTYKHVTPNGFMWLSYNRDDGKVFRAAGGTYTLHGDSYTEKIEYGMGDDFEVIKNAEHAFTAKVDGDRWMHTGKLANGTTIDEVWERVRPQSAK